ncbi:NACHT domain-containing protein [Motilibacter aurantiacus]|uniref:NACHT domain-containing protein n=1 Tax=Motilibacter aurantiacus TaxID=2714955 RepID=UPI00140B9367|nr:hypothetical protein [Motilibacter aurantiacus]NHC47657.1 hypothetical protein [Motilibacter aurantiacus]
MYQVKRYKRFGVADLRDAVREYAGAPDNDAGRKSSRFNARRFVVVTSVAVDNDTAMIDALALLKDEYRGRLQVDLWGAEAVSTRLRNMPAVVLAVFGQAWAREYCGGVVRQGKGEDEVEEVARLALAAHYVRDNEVRFRQVELTGVTVESLFVDVPVVGRPGTEVEAFLRDINPRPRPPLKRNGATRPPPIEVRTEPFGLGKAGAAQALLHPNWAGSAVLVGGPGQGKTTLLQFLCQFYRARILARDEYSPIAADLSPVTEVARLPIKVELTDYAAWRRELLGHPAGVHPKVPRRPESSQPNASLESFMAIMLAQASGRDFSVRQLSVLVTTRAVLLAFDGLDEVADADERDEIADEIRATSVRMRANALDAQLIVATRPGSVGRPMWRDPHFQALFLSSLTPALRMKYLERWVAQSRLDSAEIADLRRTFTESITMPHVVDLAGNPMQLAILLHLMQRRAVLPEKRTALYDRYIDVFMDRESKSQIVAEHKDLIIAFHKLLAWRIHTQVELGQSKGAIGLVELKALLTEYLLPRGRDAQFVDELFKSVTTRVLCLVQRELDSQEFQFEVQPLREYFAAEHLYDTLPSDTNKNNRMACLTALIRRPFWSNVMRFFAGKLSSGEVPALIYMLKELQQDRYIGEHPISRIAAKLFLDDQVLGGQVQLVVDDMVRVVLEGSGPVLAVDGLIQQDESLLRFHERAGRKQAVDFLTRRLLEHNDEHTIAAVVQILDHWGETRNVVRAWWAAAAEAEAGVWLLAGTALRGLTADNEERRRRLTANASQLNQNMSLLDLLLASASDVVDDELVLRCFAELKDGYVLRQRVLEASNGPYARLLAASSVDRFYARQAKGPSVRTEGGLFSTDKASDRDARASSVADGQASYWHELVSAFDEAHAWGDLQESRSWEQCLDTYEGVWGGDCWPLREAVLAAPDGVIAELSAKPDLSENAAWRSVGRWRREAIENKTDGVWWSIEASACVHRLSTMSFLTSILQVASSEAVGASTDTLNDLVERLDHRDWALVAAAVSRAARLSPYARTLRLGDALRLRLIEPSPRLAVLLWTASGDGTRQQLAPYIARDAGRLWGSGSEIAGVLTRALAILEGKLNVDQLRGGRADVPEGTLDSTRLIKIRYGQAQEILRNPELWPTDVVRSAADRLGMRLSDQEPVSEVAKQQAWNA